MSNLITLYVVDITKMQKFQHGEVHILEDEDIRQITDTIAQGGWSKRVLAELWLILKKESLYPGRNVAEMIKVTPLSVINCIIYSFFHKHHLISNFLSLNFSSNIYSLFYFSFISINENDFY